MPVLVLRDYQKAGVDFLTDRKRCILGDEAGLGKTVTVLESVKRTDGYPALIIGTKVSLYVWKNELEKWYDMPCAVYSGPPKNRAEQLELFKRYDVPVLVTNYAFAEEIKSKIECSRLHFKTLVCDEIHLGGLLNRNSKTFHNVKQLCTTGYIDNIFLVTGTPVRNHPGDLWAPLNIIDSSTFKSYWDFVYRYCIVIRDTFGVTIERRPKDVTVFKEMISQYLIRRKKQQVLHELPPKTRQSLIIEMTDVQERAYHKLAENAILDIGDNVIVTPNKVTNILRLRQLLVTPMMLGINDPGGGLLGIEEAMVDEFDNGRPCVIFTPFKQAVPYIQKYLTSRIKGLEVFIITGGMTAREVFEQTEKGFQISKNPKRVLICVIKSGASFNAYAASTCFFLGYEWSFVDNSQAEDRLHRIGQKDNVRALYVLCKGTVDELVAEKLNEKEVGAGWTIDYEKMVNSLKRFLNR